MYNETTTKTLNIVQAIINTHTHNELIWNFIREYRIYVCTFEEVIRACQAAKRYCNIVLVSKKNVEWSII